jgi:protein-disulfide isomerase
LAKDLNNHSKYFDMAKCNICEKEFDSDRGLHIHQSQVHTEDEESTDPEEQSTENQEPVNYDNGSFSIQLSATHALLGVFLIGMVTGGFGHTVLDNSVLTDNSQNLEPDTDTNPQPSGSQDDGQPTGGAETETVSIEDITSEGEPVLGDSDAPVTIFLYEDYQCPFCQQFEQGAVPQIVSNYVDSGQVKLVWKDLPLPQIGHEWAEPAAAAMECVYREGGNDAFWNVKDQVFNNQGSISLNNVEDQIKSYASQEGVSSSAVQSCIDNDNPMEEVNGDTQEASQVGANGTPTSIIGGEKVVGAQPFDQIQPVIERQLNG